MLEILHGRMLLSPDATDGGGSAPAGTETGSAAGGVAGSDAVAPSPADAGTAAGTTDAAGTDPIAAVMAKVSEKPADSADEVDVDAAAQLLAAGEQPQGEATPAEPSAGGADEPYLTDTEIANLLSGIRGQTTGGAAPAGDAANAPANGGTPAAETPASTPKATPAPKNETPEPTAPVTLDDSDVEELLMDVPGAKPVIEAVRGMNREIAALRAELASIKPVTGYVEAMRFHAEASHNFEQTTAPFLDAIASIPDLDTDRFGDPVQVRTAAKALMLTPPADRAKVLATIPQTVRAALEQMQAVDALAGRLRQEAESKGRQLTVKQATHAAVRAMSRPKAGNQSNEAARRLSSQRSPVGATTGGRTPSPKFTSTDSPVDAISKVMQSKGIKVR